MRIENVKRLFLAASVYDLALGLAFGFCFKCIYGFCGIELPNHDAFIQFPAALVAVFGIGFLLVSRDPARHRGIIVLGMLLKAAYVGIVGGHWLFGSMPVIFVPWIFIDFVFLLLFAWAWKATAAPG